MERLSSSFVVAPSYRPPMVFVAIFRTSTFSSPWPQRATARTILLTSTGSREPLRLRTCIVVAFASSLVPLAVFAGELVAVFINTTKKKKQTQTQNHNTTHTQKRAGQ